MRTFIAIELPQEIKNSLSQIQAKLKTTGADVKWVEPKNIHLTLKFLGEINEAQLAKIKIILKDCAKEKNAFISNISSIGVFPKINFPRVIWLGIEKGSLETKEIAKELEENIAKIGIPKEDRPFSSHITIGRTKSMLNKENLIKELEKLNHNWGREKLEFSVAKITLFKSSLSSAGPTYEILEEATLKTT